MCARSLLSTSRIPLGFSVITALPPARSPTKIFPCWTSICGSRLPARPPHQVSSSGAPPRASSAPRRRPRCGGNREHARPRSVLVASTAVSSRPPRSRVGASPVLGAFPSRGASHDSSRRGRPPWARVSVEMETAKGTAQVEWRGVMEGGSGVCLLSRSMSNEGKTSNDVKKSTRGLIE